MILITNTIVGFIRQRLNKVRGKVKAKASRTYKEQECLAILEIARACGLWLHPHATTNKGAYLGRFYSPAFCLQHQKQGKLRQQGAETTHQNKHFDYNSTYTQQTNKGDHP